MAIATRQAKVTVRPQPRLPCSSGPCAKRPQASPWKHSTVLCWAGPIARKARRPGWVRSSPARTPSFASPPTGAWASSRRRTPAPSKWRSTLLGARPVDILAFESFSEGWATDVVQAVETAGRAHALAAPYGKLPDLAAVDPAHDIVLAWNGTTSGVRLPNADWIAADREGLVICDATSAAFAMDLPWDKLDVVTWSWQKVLGGEAAHGMLALSPRAVERLLSYTPPWPLPKIFRLTSGGKLSEGVFKGETINTPSMLCVEDALDGLRWAESAGGLKGLIGRCDANLARRRRLGGPKSDWAGFLAEDPATRSCTSICLTIVRPLVYRAGCRLPDRGGEEVAALLEKEGVANDIAAYRDAPPGLRIWGGATVETSDIAALLPWLDWAHAQIRNEFSRAAEWL